MNELVNFVKEILMLETKEKMPIGLCSFDCNQDAPKVKSKSKQKKELRLSELMDK